MAGAGAAEAAAAGRAGAGGAEGLRRLCTQSQRLITYHSCDVLEEVQKRLAVRRHLRLPKRARVVAGHQQRRGRGLTATDQLISYCVLWATLSTKLTSTLTLL